MAFGTSSKVFARTILTQLTGAHAFDWDSDTMKVALFGNTGTPDNTVATDVLTEYNGTASAWVVANEASGTGYTAGGVAVTPLSVAQASNVITFSSSGTPTWTITGTITAYGGLVYDTTVSNIGLAYNAFGGAQTVTAGTFSVAWNASGIATFTV